MILILVCYYGYFCVLASNYTPIKSGANLPILYAHGHARQIEYRIIVEIFDICNYFVSLFGFQPGCAALVGARSPKIKITDRLWVFSQLWRCAPFD